jgi:hypothetical protein
MCSGRERSSIVRRYCSYWGALAERKRTSLNSLKAPSERARLVPIEVGSHIGASPAASAADKSRLEIRQANIIGTSIVAGRL